MKKIALIIPVCLGLLSFGLGVMPQSPTVMAASKAPVLSDKVMPSALPPGMDISKLGKVDKQNLPNLPINDASFLPKKPVKDNPKNKQISLNGCYPPGAYGYQAICVNPNYEQTATGGYSHYGVDPYNGAGVYRYVYIVDEVAGTRASEWLAWLINDLNTNWFPGNPSNTRPYFIYFEASWLRAQNPGYSAYHDCQGSLRQFVEVCAAAPGNIASTGFSNDAASHVGTADIHIDALTGGPVYSPADYYTSYEVLHEFGHAFGLAHDTDCESPMTYCGTIGTKYLWYTASNYAVLNSLYGHIN